MQYYIAAHDFHAEEEMELSVDKGEILCATEGVAQDGWMKVEVIPDASRRGFVPLSYLNDLTNAEATALLQATGNISQPGSSKSPTQSPLRLKYAESSPTSAQRAANPSKETAESCSTGLGSTAQIRSPQRQSTWNPERSLVVSTAPLTPAQQAAGPVNRHLLENPSAVVDAFMKNEVYFKQLMQRRSSALTQMQFGIEEAMTEVAACKDRGAVLTRKLRDLDDVVERERTRWAERVEEEKAHISSSAPYNRQLAGPLSGTTTPVRSPITGRRDGPGRSLMEVSTPRQLHA